MSNFCVITYQNLLLSSNSRTFVENILRIYKDTFTNTFLHNFFQISWHLNFFFIICILEVYQESETAILKLNGTFLRNITYMFHKNNRNFRNSNSQLSSRSSSLSSREIFHLSQREIQRTRRRRNPRTLHLR